MHLVEESDTYFIRPLENVLIPLTNLIQLKIPIPKSNLNYYIEYRRPLDYDMNNSDFYSQGFPPGTDLYGGAMIHTDLFVNTGDTQLIDLNPNSEPIPPTIRNSAILGFRGRSFKTWSNIYRFKRYFNQDHKF